MVAAVAVALGLAAVAPATQAAPPPVGVPVQLAPPDACYSTTAAGGCSAFTGSQTVNGAEPIVISADGLFLYLGGSNGGGVTFSRNAAGALATLGSAGGFASTGFALDGAGLFSGFRDSGSNNGEVDALARGASGLPVFVNRVVDGCPTGTAHCATNNGLYDVEGVAVAAGGTRVYAASHFGGGGSTGGALTVFSRNPTTQAIAQLQCFPQTASASGLCSSGSTPGLSGAEGIALSADGKFLYVGGYFDSAVVGFNLVQSGPSAGNVATVVNCLWSSASSGNCSQTTGVGSVKGLALSPDGRDLYVAQFNNSIEALRRDPVSGVLSFNQCFVQGGGGGCSGDPAIIAGARDVAVSPDGRFVYLSGGGGTAGFLRTYVRDGVSGQLSPLACATYLAATGCTTAAGLQNADKLALSPDGRNLYLSAFQGGDGNGAVAAFRIQMAPSCQGAGVSVVAGTSTTLPLVCSDASGDPITRTIAGSPSKGTLGAINQSAGTVTYTANTGASGADSVAFGATDGTNASAVATDTITVLPPPAGNPPAGKPAPPHSRIVGLSGSVRAAKLKSLHGDAAGGRPVVRVEIAIERLIGGARLAAKHRPKAQCLELDRKGRFVALKVKRGRCSVSHFLAATGTSTWTFRLPRRLPRGTYVLTSRATDSAGVRESVFSAALGNRRSFTVR